MHIKIIKAMVNMTLLQNRVKHLREKFGDIVELTLVDVLPSLEAHIQQANEALDFLEKVQFEMSITNSISGET